LSERDGYPEGVPCWVETVQRDPRAALEFYGPLFGWEFSGDEYFVARLRGRDVAGIGPLPGEGQPFWATYIRVESVDAVAERAVAAGGTVLIGAIDAAPAGRLVVLGDASGVPFALWEPNERSGAQLVNEPGAWTMSSLHSPDPGIAADFYGEVFGWRFEALGPVLQLCRLDGYAGEAGQAIPQDTVALVTRTAPGVPPHWNVNLRVHDADATGDLAVRLGGTLLGPPIEAHGLRNAVIADPQGAVFSVSSAA
jgi:predicted enzyme related to lactoylglutathione lyase